MNKEQLEHFNDTKKDLLFWIKHYLCSRIATQKLDTEYTDDRKAFNKSDDPNIKIFDRELYQKMLMEAKNINEVKDIATKVTKNGLKSHTAIFTPVVMFYNYVASTKSIDTIRKITTDQVHTFMMLDLKTNKKTGKPYSDWTKKNYYTVIKGMFIHIDKYSISGDGFMFDIGFTSYGTKATKPISMHPQASEKYLEPNEFVAFASKIKKLKTNHPNQAQPRLLLKILAFTGVRANEVRHIRLEDVGFRTIDRNKYIQIFVRGKGKSDRYVFIDFRLIANEYEQDLEYRKENKIEHNYLLYNSKLNQHSDKGMYELVRRSFLKLGVFKDIHIHSLCKSFSTYLHSRGVSLERIGLLLGHSSEEMSEFYVFASKSSFKGVKNLLRCI